MWPKWKITTSIWQRLHAPPPSSNYSSGQPRKGNVQFDANELKTCVFCSCHVPCRCVTWLGASQAEGHGAAERNGSGSKSLSAIVEYGSGDSSKYLASFRLTAKHGPWQERTRLWTPSLQTQSGRLLQPSRTGSWRGSEAQQENTALFPLQWLDNPPPPWDDPGTRRSAERGSGVGGKAADSLANSDRFLEDVCDHRRSGRWRQPKPSPLLRRNETFVGGRRRLGSPAQTGWKVPETIAVSRICRPILLPNNSRWSRLPMRRCLLDVGTFDIRSITRSNLWMLPSGLMLLA